MLTYVNATYGDTNSVPVTFASSYLQETILEIKKNTTNIDSINYHRTKAIEYAEIKNIEKANEHIEKYIRTSGDLSFVNQYEFDILEDSLAYQDIVKSFSPSLNGWVLFFFFSSVVGIFISVVLNFQKGNNKSANILIALFVFFHSILIADLGLYSSNFRFQMPNSLFVSTTFSFLYGPLLYFYFRKTSFNYKFKAIDALHLIPSIILLLYIFPYYILAPDEKLYLMLNLKKYLVPGGSLIFLSKAISLIVYAYLIFKICNRQSHESSCRPEFKDWQNKICTFFSVYALSYVVYGLSLMKIIDVPYLVHIQGVILSCLVLYIAYSAFAKPLVFLSVTKKLVVVEAQNDWRESEVNDSVEKYQKSGLTPDFSLELRDYLMRLFGEEKIFRINNLTLEMLSEKLGTNRHNTSQVINEHFNMNFFELVNQYRVDAAKQILEDDSRKGMNIIDVAYEVGYNNKVTFNKSFKKDTQLTPSQYRKLYAPEIESQVVLEISSENGTNLFSGSGMV